MEWIICLIVLLGIIKIVFDLIVNSKRKKLLLLWGVLFAISIAAVVLLVFTTVEAMENDRPYKGFLLTASIVFTAAVIVGFLLWLSSFSTFTCEECGNKYKFQPIWSKKRILWSWRFGKFRCPNCKNWCKPKFTYFDYKIKTPEKEVLNEGDNHGDKAEFY